MSQNPARMNSSVDEKFCDLGGPNQSDGIFAFIVTSDTQIYSFKHRKHFHK